MDIATVLYPFTVVWEAIVALTSVQFALIDVFFILTAVSVYLMTRMHEREKAAAEKARLEAEMNKRINELVRDMTKLVAVELTEGSEHYGTYVELGHTFVPDENDTLNGVPDKHTVMSALRAKTTGAKRRRTVLPDDVPLR